MKARAVMHKIDFYRTHCYMYMCICIIIYLHGVALEFTCNYEVQCVLEGS